MDIASLISGYAAFRDKKFKKYQNRFIDLVEQGQRPKVLFIGCSDSRVDPALITNSDPGELFILRNVGNLIPPFSPDNDFHGTAAGIEYAVSVLNVTDIIVCGHSHCGAIDGLYRDITDPALVHVKKWLELGKQARDYVEETIKESASEREKLSMTERISVVFQLNNLLTYPEVARKVETGEVSLRGWYYKIKTGELEYYNEETMRFEPMIGGAC
jgi:carbonic anhydrase